MRIARDNALETMSTDAQFALLHCLAMVGEAANQLDAPFRAEATDIPWATMIGLRHVIIHRYRRVDMTEILRIVERDLPPVLQRITRYLAENTTL